MAAARAGRLRRRGQALLVLPRPRFWRRKRPRPSPGAKALRGKGVRLLGRQEQTGASKKRPKRGVALTLVARQA